MELKEYKAQLRSVFYRNTHSGFVDWRHCGNLEMDCSDILWRAEKDFCREQRYKELFELTCAAFIKWSDTDKDDSNGETQDFVYGDVFGIWDEIYDKNPEDIPHSRMLDWFMKKADGSLIDYMEDFLLEYMMNRFREPELQDRKLDFLSNRISEYEKDTEDNSWNRYEIYQCRECILKIYGELKKPIEEIRKYADGLARESSRKLLADIELEYGNSDECLAIYRELADKETAPYFRTENNEKLKNLYKEFGMSEEYSAQVEKLLVMKTGDLELWDEYRKIITENEWENTVKNLFESFETMDCRPLPWYAAEGRYDLVMDAVEYGGTYYLEHYEGELCQRYPERCLEVLVKEAEFSADNSKNRRDYRNLAKTLRWMRRYPEGAERAAELAEQYRQRYPRRSAMIDELRGI